MSAHWKSRVPVYSRLIWFLTDDWWKLARSISRFDIVRNLIKFREQRHNDDVGKGKRVNNNNWSSSVKNLRSVSYLTQNLNRIKSRSNPFVHMNYDMSSKTWIMICLENRLNEVRSNIFGNKLKHMFWKRNRTFWQWVEERHKFYSFTDVKYQYLNLFIEVLEFSFWNQIITLTNVDVFLNIWSDNNLLFLHFRYCLRYLLFYLSFWCLIYYHNSTYVLSDRDVSVRMSSPIMISMTWGIEFMGQDWIGHLVIYEMDWFR